jgi:hypothetical protein
LEHDLLLNESIWIKHAIEYLEQKGVTGLTLNLGSSTSEFIAQRQPYITTNVLQKLTKLGSVVNVDIKNEVGVDLVLDFLNPSDLKQLIALNANVTLVSNLLEHIPDPEAGIRSLTKLVQKGNYLILTGPKQYPYHPDPIDNRFRPGKKQITKLLGKEFEIIKLDYVKGGTVLTATVDDSSLAYNWLFSQLTVKNLLKIRLSILKHLRNLITPASAFCLLAKKL